MKRYTHSRLTKMVISWFYSSIFSSLLLIGLMIVLWRGFFAGIDALSVVELGSISLFNIFFLLTTWIRTCSPCLSVIPEEKGVSVKTCVFLQFLIPWENIVEIREYKRLPWITLLEGGTHKSVVAISRGLTPIHYNIIKTKRGKLRLLRAFSISSAGKGYSELVEIIEEHIDLNPTSTKA